MGLVDDQLVDGLLIKGKKIFNAKFSKVFMSYCLRDCKLFCVTASLNIVLQTVFEQDHEPVQGHLPISNWHSPLF